MESEIDPIIIKVIDLYVKEGLSLAKTALAVGKNTYFVNKILKERNLVRKKGEKQGKTLEERENFEANVISRYQEGKSMAFIAKENDCDDRVIKRILTKHNIELRPKNPVSSALDEMKIIEMYQEDDLNASEIGRILEVSYSTIQRILEKNNVPKKSMSDIKRKYDIKEDFFDVIDTEEKAYILGMLYADGYNNEETSKVRLNLHKKDEEIVEKIKNIISPERPLYYYKDDRLDNVTVTFCNKHMSETLAKLGCMQAKSFKIVFPNFLQDSLVSHFIRGYFDGDGCITSCMEGNYRRYSLSFVGTESFVNSIKSILKEKLDANGIITTRFPERNNNTRTFSTSGNR